MCCHTITFTTWVLQVYLGLTTINRKERKMLVASPDWSDNFPHSELKHIVSSRSDHCPILLCCNKLGVTKCSPKTARYEMMWEREESLEEEIRIAWNGHANATCLEKIQYKLKATMEALSGWSSQKFGAVTKEINNIRKKLERLLSNNQDGYSTEIDNLNKRLDELLLREEIMWRQRSRITWLKHGDQNTKFFHRKATWRAKKNKISTLQKEDGTIIENPTELQSMANEYFDSMYTKDNLVVPELIEELIVEKVDQQMNNKLTENFSDEEIGNALFQIGPLKAPGADGFPARFFQRNWGILKDEILAAVRIFFKDGTMPEGINETIIVLVPKHNDPKTLKDYRPIALCNVIYKIIAKCIANRLRPLLDGLISENQSAFIPGRLITDNALIAFECFHHIQRNQKIEGAFCAYKLDLTKAYERVDWRYLQMVLTKFGFHPIFVGWIM
jgi:hypothetical protein